MTDECGDGLKLVRLPEAGFPDEHVLNHLRKNFYADEPLNRAVGLCNRGEAHAELDRHCASTLAHNCSCIIVDQKQSKIAGAALNGIVRKGDREECERRLAELKDSKFRSIFGLLYSIDEKVDLFERYNVDELFECRILSVQETYRGRGLANVLVENSIRIAQQAGFKVMKADATGIFSQKVFRKYGFDVVTEIPYSEVDENLRPGPPHEALKLMVKVLDQDASRTE
ncbi:hypothetical protein QAD02_019636 [Eretmocerus hayati]|uniref:Uncharacterized protein n=1 Tax=Eretmocerus hayati TaxID=131215 RepID=A0ACC2PJS8_9HYME|nr:hypothetical protein QAD02_019636 [Eretmocerus hayati]